MRRLLRDVVFVVPGITGSVLERDGREIWAPSHRLAARTALRPASGAEALTLHNGLSDGVTAPRLVPDLHMVGGLVKIDGYSLLVESISRNFQVVRGSATDEHPANVIEFPYDWRLDNRVNALRLAELVPRALERWRRHTDAVDVRAVFVAHSMGGLIARYFLEVLEGWRQARALITFGTPFRGSLDALGYVANGYKKLHVDLSVAMRSFPSVYQLMPIYPVVGTGSGYLRVAETPGIPNVDPHHAADALAFHREVESAVEANDRAEPNRYALLPVVGTHQRTRQSATFDGDALVLSDRTPPGVEPLSGDDPALDGDGTVPAPSASPIDFSGVYSDMYKAEKHSSLQRNTDVLTDMLGKLAKMQARQLRKVRAPAEYEPRSALAPGLSLEVDDEYLATEPVSIRSHVQHDALPEHVVADLEPLAGGEPRRVSLASGDAGWNAELGPLPPGSYRVRVTAHGAGCPPGAVHDVFHVLP